MSSQSNIQHFFFLLSSVFCLLVSACGFKPLYGKHEESRVLAPLLAGIEIGDISGERRIGQQFTIDLEDRLNPGGVAPTRPTYRLNASLSRSVSAIGAAPDGTVSRYNMHFNTSFTLIRIADGETVASGSINHISSYNNVTNAYFSTYISEQDAIKRGLAELAEIYRQRLTAHLTNKDTTPQVESPAQQKLTK